MNRNTKIPLGKKDAVLREWWDNVSKDNISQPICLAIAYYSKTGKFLQIGTVSPSKIEYDNTIKYVYIPEKSIAYKFLNEKQEQGEKIASIVKYILRNSIKESATTRMYDVDELRKQLEEISHTEVRYYANPFNITEQQIGERNVSTEQPPSADAVSQTTVSYIDDDDDGDLISALLGDAGFVI